MRIRNATRVLVTGSAGVIGRELLRRLGERGADVLSVDRLPLPPGPWGGVTHERLDLADAPLEALHAFSPQVVFHLAAAFERSEESPEFGTPNWHDNAVASHRVTEIVARTPSIGVVVFASSYLIYDPDLYMFGEAPTAARALEEGDRVSPRNLCGAAKYYAERELEFVRRVQRPALRTTYARIYRVFGLRSRDIVSRWVRAALAGDRVTVYNKRNLFDYVFAGDVAEGLLRLAECDGQPGIVNLATGRPRRVEEVLGAIARRLPSFASRITDEGAAPPFEASAADVTRLRDLTQWAPETTLEAGIEQLVDHEMGARTPAVTSAVAEDMTARGELSP